MHALRVIGVPRSGTNLVKYLVESSTDVTCFFNLGWWKHAVIPVLMTGQQVRADDTPTIILFREPLRQIASFYNYARKGRNAMSGAEGFETFIASPIRMVPFRDSIEYHFCSPVEYWIQFYHAATTWNARNRFFIDLAELQRNPGIISAALAEMFPDRREAATPRLPEKYLGRNPDRPVADEWLFESDTTVENEAQEVEQLLGSLSPGAVAGILNARVTALHEQMRAARFCKFAA